MDTRDIHAELVAALERRGKTRQAGDLVEFCCPRHEDKNPSAWLGEWRWGCHACGFEERLDSLCDVLGIDPPKYGFTLEDYADLKGFSIVNLRRWGVETGRTSKFDNDLVAIPYRDANGKTLRVKFRKASGTFWDPDNDIGHTYLYGLDMLAKTPATMPVILVEGESDCHAAWSHQKLAVGVPGANGWKSEWKSLLVNREVYVWQEPGQPGAKFTADICRDLLNAKVIQTNGSKDLADLHKEVGKNFGAAFDRLVAEAQLPDLTPEPSASPQPQDGTDVMKDVVQRSLGTLGEHPEPKALNDALGKLTEATASFTDVQRTIVRSVAVEMLSTLQVPTPAALLDAALKGSSKTASDIQGQVATFADPEPWPDPVDGVSLLEEMSAFVRRFAILPTGAVDVLATFALMTHVTDAFRTVPYLALESPTPECGKTRVLEVLNMLTARPWFTMMPSTAVLFRVLEQFHPTMLLDECQAVRGRGETAENVRDLLLAGYKRGATVPRCVGDQHEVRLFDVFGPKVFALIGELPGALASRCIRIGMQRRREDEPVDSLLGVEEEAAVLARRARRWADDYRETLRQTTPPSPEFLRDRLAETWQPLLTVGLVAGGGWDARLMEAARALGRDREADDVRTLLLTDVRSVFTGERVSSADLVAALTAIEGRPWADWKGRELTANALARLLKPLGITSKKLKFGDQSLWGYKVEAFTEAWERYLPAMQPDQPEPCPFFLGFLPVCNRNPRGCRFRLQNPSQPRNCWKVPVGPVALQGRPGDGPVPDERVKELAREYAIGHPDCSRDDVINHLGLGVPLTVANAAIDELAKSEKRFAGLRDYEAEERQAIQDEGEP